MQIFATDKDWILRDGSLYYENDLLELELSGDIQEKKEWVDENLHKFVLQEWCEYKLRYNFKKDEKEISAFFGGFEANHEKRDKFFTYTYENYIGKSAIRLSPNNFEVPNLEFEVSSPKLTTESEEDELYYPRFWRNITNDLTKFLLILPFEPPISPTSLATEGAFPPPNLIMLYNMILLRWNEILEGINTISYDPYKHLERELVWVDLAQADQVLPITCIKAIENPHLLMSSNLILPLSEKLGGYLPRKLAQKKNKESLNNPENRFIKSFISNLLIEMEEIEQSKFFQNFLTHGESKKIENWETLHNSLERFIQSELFAEVEEMNISSSLSSQVLLKKSGYRELVIVYYEFLSSRAPIFTNLQETMEARKISKMYEYWCFFKLVESLRLLIGSNVEPTFTLNVTDFGELQNSVTAHISNYKLIYNKSYAPPIRSYSVSLRPDYSLYIDGELACVFDAKFKFDLMYEEVYDSDETYDDPKREAKMADIYKMHTYRDALKVNSAIILYPGNKNAFFPLFDGNKTIIKEEIFKRILSREQGIGYLSFYPTSL